MKKYFFDGIEVSVPSSVSIREAEEYLGVADAEARASGERVIALTVSVLPDGNVDLDATWRPPQFVRIRRITGYLVSDLARWGAAKRSEERDRLKHTSATGCCGEFAL